VNQFAHKSHQSGFFLYEASVSPKATVDVFYILLVRMLKTVGDLFWAMVFHSIGLYYGRL